MDGWDETMPKRLNRCSLPSRAGEEWLGSDAVAAVRRALIAGVGALLAMCMLGGGIARADAVAYLVNVTVRPGYNFPNADAALAYGHALCGKIANGVPFAQLVTDVTRDFAATDPYQGSYLVSQATQELCPQLISQLRQSAAGYRG